MISTLEKEITFRYLKTRKKDGFLNVISIFSFIGISLGVAVLIIVMSVMNGFRTELINKIVGFNAHVTVKPYENSINLEKLKDNNLKLISKELIFSNSGEAIVISKDYTKGLVLRGYSSKDFSKLDVVKKGKIIGEANTLTRNSISIGKELSFNNYSDIFAALEILSSIKKDSATVIIKHSNPCGVAKHKSPLSSFKKAYAGDPISAFGGVIACNFKINKKIAEEIDKNFLEVILAKSFDSDALSILKKRKNLRIIDISKFSIKSSTDIKFFNDSFLIQSKDILTLEKKKLKFVTYIKPTKKEIAEIEFAFNICKHVKSNAIVLTNNFSSIGIGAGQPSRLDSCRIAAQKARQFQPSKIRNSVAASDAFFPFPDGIKILIKAGVKIIVQPGGSVKDKEIINTANKAKIKMVFTGIRHFNH